MNYFEHAEWMEKLNQRKPIKLSYEPLIQAGWYWGCPSCGNAVGINQYGRECTQEDPFCPSCGQKIDWS